MERDRGRGDGCQEAGMISVQGRGRGSQSTEARAQSVGFHFISFPHQTDFQPVATEYPWWVFFTRNLVLQTSSLS